MPEQFRLDFGAEKKSETTEGEPALESLGYDDLQALYKEKVGVNHRGLNRGELINAIQDPEAEKARLAEEDMKADQEERASTRAGR